MALPETSAVEPGREGALRRLAQTLAQEPSSASAIGAACIFEITGAGAWTIDCTSAPARLIPGAAPYASCGIRISESEVHNIFGDRRRNERLVWRGDLEVHGTREALGRFDEVFFSGEPDAEDRGDGFYAALAELVPDKRFAFLNMGFSRPGTPYFALEERERPWRHAIALVRHVISGLDLRGTDVLDVGCGRGGPCAYVSRYHRAAQMVGLDICEPAIRLAAAAFGSESVSFVPGNAMTMPFADASFDVALNVESADAYRDAARFFAEAHRVLRPEGHLAIAHCISPDALQEREDTMAAAGFAILRSTDITADVLLGIDSNREHVARLFSRFIDPQLQNARILNFLVRSINEVYRQRLAMRSTIYNSWLLRRSDR